ncbi:MAG: Asp23/Gls24 family envelope stress response protein [Oscillospiraceae bacterium]|nr:Asp23/Gls24 family envelope stress response protein [Oscillospiraceae bacterium]
MMMIENHLGSIRVTKDYLYKLIARTVSSCFGVADLNDVSLMQTVQSKIFPDDHYRGILLKAKHNKLAVDLHIITGIGANMTAITDSIRNKVRYAVEQSTGIEPTAINVYIDGIRA